MTPTITLRPHQVAAADAVEAAFRAGVRRPLSLERLRELLDYDQETGVFRWKPRPVSHPFHIAWNNVNGGQVAGTPTHHGYFTIRIERRHYYQHRLAYFYVTGEMPPKGVDHKEGKSNRFANLRPATQTQNNGNRKRGNHNTSGYKGVSIHRTTGKWQARLKINGKSIWLGTFLDPKDAAAAYLNAARQYFGEFANPGQ